MFLATDLFPLVNGKCTEKALSVTPLSELLTPAEEAFVYWGLVVYLVKDRWLQVYKDQDEQEKLMADRMLAAVTPNKRRRKSKGATPSRLHKPLFMELLTHVTKMRAKPDSVEWEKLVLKEYSERYAQTMRQRSAQVVEPLDLLALAAEATTKGPTDPGLIPGCFRVDGEERLVI